MTIRNNVAVTDAADTSTTDTSALPEWRRRWRDLQQARAALAQWNETVRGVEQVFEREIAPRERQLTSALITLTTRLVARFTDRSLDTNSQSLIGQWIIENLSTLGDHPFADRVSVDRIAASWRAAISPGEDAVSTESDQGPVQRSSFHARPKARSESSPEFNRVDDAAENHRASTDAIQDVDTRTLIAPLFRRLAQTLHPDREPDPARRAIKQSLMQTALDARARADVDALLELHFTHVGEQADIIDGISASTLVKALERQMESVQSALRIARYGNPLRRRIVERYGSDHETRSRRIANHARQLDNAIVDMQNACAQVLSTSGLAEALMGRQDAELDRHFIDEMTGMC